MTRADPNCAEPVCDSKTDMFRSGVLGKKKKHGKTPLECPLDREELGRASWGLLHTMAAYYPENPSDVDKARAKAFVDSFAQLYPCKHCAADFQESIQVIPPRVNSRIDFSLWMCEQHNRVTTKLDKKPFPCTIDALDKRWKTGVPACWAKKEDEITAEESLGQD
ncbi:unnamed protein product [Aphanomyces euteiches]|uniref:Sulfhydryl oxidase n=1 Tax=Aphanomyces euteiches TaxID=100861 RepID=A0A6G0XTN2_9STRA|nr:hypothetical protein Ae201684_001385 [Aphanomyces euteiches]KAH9149442.1 hypothetical protein AeRB84_007497 [Aphanomyces euteiches]